MSESTYMNWLKCSHQMLSNLTISSNKTKVSSVAPDQFQNLLNHSHYPTSQEHWAQIKLMAKQTLKDSPHKRTKHLYSTQMYLWSHQNRRAIYLVKTNSSLKVQCYLLLILRWMLSILSLLIRKKVLKRLNISNSVIPQLNVKKTAWTTSLTN